MSIAELFYPKELKDVITDLQNKNDLNGAAVKNINVYIYVTLKKLLLVFIAFCLFLFILDAHIEAWWLTIVTFVYLPITIYIDLKIISKKVLKLYNYGLCTEGCVLSYGTHRGAYGISCSFKYEKKEYLSHISGVRIGLRRDTLKKGLSIKICFDPHHPQNSCPFIPSLAELFYLRNETSYVCFS